MCLTLEERALALAAQRNLVVFPEYRDLTWDQVARDFVWSIELGNKPTMAWPCRELADRSLDEVRIHLLSESQVILEAFKAVADEAVEDYRRRAADSTEGAP